MKKLLIVLIALLFTTSCFGASVGSIPKHIIFKGVNTKAGPLSLDDGESPDCMNVHTSLFGTLVRRNGYTKETINHLHITTTPGEFNGLYNYSVSAGNDKLVAMIDENLYKMDNLDGVFDPVHTGVNPNPLTDNIASFENFDGTLIVSTWGRDYGRQWNGSGLYSHIQLMPRGKYIAKAYQRLFVSDVKINSTVYGLRFYYSEPGSFTDWGDGASYATYDDSSNYETLDAPAGDVAMGWGLCRGNLYGFTKNTVNLVNNESGTNPIVPYRRLDGIGCGAPRTIKTVNIPGSGEVMIWMTNDRKLVAWTGYGAVKFISDKIDGNNGQSPIAVELIHPTNFVYSHAQVYEKEGWYVLWFPTILSSTNYYGVVYDYKTDTLWPIDRQPFKSSAVVDTTNGDKIYVGDYSGKTYTWDNGNSDDGNAINSYWISRKWDFGWMPILKKGKEIQITTKTIGDYSVRYDERYNFDSSWTNTQHISLMPAGGWVLGDVLPVTLGTVGASTARYDIGYTFNLYQVRLSNNTTNPAYEIYSVDMLASAMGNVND